MGYFVVLWVNILKVAARKSTGVPITSNKVARGNKTDVDYWEARTMKIEQKKKLLSKKNWEWEVESKWKDNKERKKEEWIEKRIYSWRYNTKKQIEKLKCEREIRQIKRMT